MLFFFFSLAFSRDIDPSTIQDEAYEKAFYIHNEGKDYFINGEDLHVVEAWKNGYSGAGTTITVLTTGAKMTHEDLKDKINTNANYNFADEEQPPCSDEDKSKIGTEVLSIAAAAINGKATVGVAPDASIAAATFDNTHDYDINDFSAIISSEK